MKKKFTAFIIAAIVCLACVPLFSGCSAKTVLTLSEDADGNKYYVASFSGFPNGLKGELVIPEEKDGVPVTEIAAEGFSGTAIRELVIPKSIKKIGAAAFAYNYSLKKVTFAEGCEIGEISQGMFGYCESLTEISMPPTVEKVGAMAFTNCTSLTAVNLSQNVTQIGAMAFTGCTSLKEIVLPDSLTTIGEQAFYTTGLTGIVIPDSVHDIEKDVLDENGQPKLDESGKKITETTFGIGRAAFHTCTGLKYAVVGKGTEVLRSGVFGYCPAMGKLYLPKELKSIEGAYIENGEVIYKHAFHHNKSLAEIYYGGTQEMWTELLKKVNNETLTVSGDSEKYDNSALFNAHINYESSGLPRE